MSWGAICEFRLGYILFEITRFTLHHEQNRFDKYILTKVSYPKLYEVCYLATDKFFFISLFDSKLLIMNENNTSFFERSLYFIKTAL